MKLKATATLIYSLFVITGGLMGYIKANSLPSLVMGSIFGLLLLFCAIAIFRESVLGHFSAIGIGFILLAFFTYRFFQTYALMPAGLMIVLSVGLLVVLLLKANNALSIEE